MTALAISLPKFSINPGSGIMLALLAVGLFAFYVFVYYRESRQVKRLTRGQAWILRLLRTAAAGLAVLALSGPFVEREHVPEPRPPTVGILLDDSRSMSFDEANNLPLQTDKQTRGDTARKVLDKLVGRLSEKHTVKIYKFTHLLDTQHAVTVAAGGKVPELKGLLPRNIDGKEDAPPLGEFTNIGTAGLSAFEDLGGDEISGLILLSDGQATGGDPLSQLRDKAAPNQFANRPGVPIHTITFGSENPRRKLRIETMECPNEVSVNDVLTFDVTITNQLGDYLKDMPMTLWEADADKYRKLTDEAERAKLFSKVATSKISLVRGKNRKQIHCIPETEGLRIFRVDLPPYEGQTDARDTTRSARVRVSKNQLNVLLIAGDPSREYFYLVPALERDPVVNLSCFLQSADVDYIHQGNTCIERLPQTNMDLKPYDVVVLLDPDPNGLSIGQVTAIKEMVNKGGGLMIVAGRMQGMAKLIQVHAAGIGELLPVVVGKDQDPEIEKFFDQPFGVRRVEDQKGHWILRVSQNDQLNEQVWGTFPKFYWAHRVEKAKPEAIVLLESDEGPGVRGKPLMAAQKYGEGGVVYCGLDSLWLWRYPYECYDYDNLWVRAVRYLGQARLKGMKAQAAVTTDRQSYAPGEKVTVTLGVQDMALRNQLTGKRLQAMVITPFGDEQAVDLRPIGMKNFVGTYQAKQRLGTTTVRCVYRAADSTKNVIFDINSEFEVEYKPLEDMDSRANLAAMAKLSAETEGMAISYRRHVVLDEDLKVGGVPLRGLTDEELEARDGREGFSLGDKAKVLDTEKLSDEAINKLIAAIPTKPKQLTPWLEHVDIWDGFTLLLIFLVMVSTEWSLRKWWGLL